MPEIPYDLNAVTWEVKDTWERLGTGSEALARVTSLVCERLGCATADAAFDRMYRDWRALPRATVMSGMRAGQILSLLPMLQFDRADAVARRRAEREELLRELREHGPQEVRWQANVPGLSALTALRDTGAGPAALEDALAQVDEAMSLVAPGSPEHFAFRTTHASLRAQLAQLSGGEDDFDSAVDDLAELAESPLWEDEDHVVLAGQLATFRGRQAARRQDEAALAEHIAVLDGCVDRMPAEHADRPALRANLDTMRAHLAALQGMRTGRFDPELAQSAAPPLEELRRELDVLPDDARADRLGEVAIGRGGHGMLARDPVRLSEAVELLHEAMELLEPGDERWTRYALVLGVSHVVLAALGAGSAADRPVLLDQGIAWLDHARRQAGGPEHPLWHNITQSLARACRMRGDAQVVDRRAARLNRDASRRLGMEGVRTGARGVLLQSGTGHAADTGRHAAWHALEVARWCLADGAYEDAVRALDAGRGGVLHAATVAVTVPDMLVALGHPDLAREWRGAGAVVPESGAGLPAPAAQGPSSRLRRRVLDVLAASPHQRRLLEVPALSETAAALRALGADALVYLVPAEEDHPGAAVVVAPDGSVRYLRLPGLVVDGSPLAEYRDVGAPGRDAGRPPAHPAAAGAGRPPADGRAALERLCDWAGATVMEPLLRQLPRRLGGVPSVVLVPMAELGMVPWHAARVRGRRGRYRYVCQEARVSYVPSARVLCEVAARPAAGARQALVVGDPTRDLPHAGEEARAVHAAFHPGGVLLGPADATPRAVTDWLRGQRGGLLHLACHGVVRPGERHSAYLELLGGRLAAEELTESADRFGGLDVVLLAACRTNVSGRGYDEAYSLATAFLVAGARSVVGSLWPVPDEATSLLMYMTHHYMAREGQTPGRALRSAQLWMLDEGRQAPPGMPAALLPRVRRIDAGDLAGWAGFTHLGW
ncbi:CHAT domain-containing protein [Streptomyces kanasensis]|uniref:CHAT domain-containing protein n=1 Tax=Streptomyces kanasensis TaxID=936756 RepID=UPI0036FF4F69